MIRQVILFVLITLGGLAGSSALHAEALGAPTAGAPVRSPDGWEIVSEVYKKELLKVSISVTYPQLRGLPDADVQARLNGLLREGFLPKPEQENPSGRFHAEMTASFTVRLAQDGLLSLTLDQYYYAEGAIHGQAGRRGFTMNVKNGESYERLGALLQGDYLPLLSERVRRELKARFKDKFGPVEFQALPENQGFYLTARALVLFFNPYEIGPHAMGMPEIRIPYAEIKRLIKTSGPLAWFIKL